MQAKVQDETRILCHISTTMHTNAHIFKQLGFTTTIQEYSAKHYTRIQNNLISTSKLPPDLVGGTKPKAFKMVYPTILKSPAGFQPNKPSNQENNHFVSERFCPSFAVFFLGRRGADSKFVRFRKLGPTSYSKVPQLSCILSDG